MRMHTRTTTEVFLGKAGAISHQVQQNKWKISKKCLCNECMYIN